MRRPQSAVRIEARHHWRILVAQRGGQDGFQSILERLL